MTAPKVSIVIANFNYAEYLGAAIDSALAQGDIAETIVVDDGSTDGSRMLIASYGERIIPILQKNSGACAARNAGLAIARAPFVKFLDADDWLVQGAVARQHAQATQIAPSKAAVFGDAIWVAEDGTPLADSYPIAGGPETFDLESIIGGSPLTTAPLHLREDVIAVGGFDPHVRRGQEHDLHVRLALSGVVFHYRPGPVYFYRQHSKPIRISLSDGSAGASVLDASRRHAAIAREAGLMTPGLTQAFAHRMWRQGRETLQRGAPDIAQAFFAEARALWPDKPVYGSRAYCSVNRLVGPIMAERISSALNHLRGSSSN
jgi:glycosyltransferase involved in cell wall biosynthesis